MSNASIRWRAKPWNKTNTHFRTLQTSMKKKNLGLFLIMFAALAVLYFIGAVKAVEKEVVTVVVALKHGGRLQGSILTSNQGHNFYSFRGIPYGEPPVGELRFKPPKPKEPWSDVIMDATKDGPACTQFDFMTKNVVGSEDCLRINVYTKELPGVEKTASDKTPVMVFIHGGGFTVGEGSSSFYSPVLLMDADIVLVTFNYRLNAFGFLSTGDEAAPGNYGMLDQTLALKWVRENIETFGGDPDTVMLFGQSAGGASVSHHVLSPLSKGLFHSAIMMSGSSACFWAINEDVSYWSKRLAKDVNCPTDKSQELVDCLRKKPAEELLKAISASEAKKISLFPISFSPNVDGHFLPDHPLKLLNSPDKLNQVPVISGVTQREGVFFLTHVYFTHPAKATTITSPETQDFVIGYMVANPKPVKKITELVKKAYFTSVDKSNKTQVEAAIIDISSDSGFDSCHYETISLMAKAGLPAFAYNFDYKGASSFQKLFGGGDNDWGVGHADDLYMFFDLPGNVGKESNKDMSNIMMRIWTNFAKYGIPVPDNDKSLPKWPSITDDDLSVYHFNDPITLQKFDLANDEKYRFWTKDVRKARVAKSASHGRKDEL